MDEVNPPAAPEAPKPEQPKAPHGSNDTVMLALCYVGILFLVPLFTVQTKSEVLKFHLRQGIALFVVEVVLKILVGMMRYGFGLDILLFVPVVVSIYAIIQATSGKQWEIPLIGEYAKKIKI